MPEPFSFSPIAYIRTPYLERLDAPHQSTIVEGTLSKQAETALLELEPWVDEGALADLAGFEHIWLIFVFDRSEGWNPKVKPPRGGPKRGVLSTRSPHRPNAIGLSAVQLISVEGRTLRLKGVDLLDGTPILDIKPYVPYADAFPDSQAGWIDQLNQEKGTYWAPGPKKPRKAKNPSE